MWVQAPPEIKSWTLSAHGRSIIHDDLAYLPVNYHKLHTYETYSRTSPGNSLMATWKHPMRTAAEMIMSWKPAGPDAILMERGEMHSAFTVPARWKGTSLT